MRNSILILAAFAFFTTHYAAAQCNSCDEPSLFIDNQTSERMCVTIYECEFVVNLGFPICTPVLQTIKPVGTITVQPFNTECFPRSYYNNVIVGVLVEHWENSVMTPCQCITGFSNIYLDISNRTGSLHHCSTPQTFNLWFQHCNDPELCSMATLTIQP